MDVAYGNPKIARGIVDKCLSNCYIVFV